VRDDVAMRRTVSALGVALAAAVAPSGAPAEERADGAATTRHALSLGASSRDVVLGERVRLRGRLTRRPSGAGEAGRRVVLQADPFPFDGFRTVARTRTGERGGFAFSQRPRRNTRYRVAAPAQEVTTSPLTVYADLRGGVASFTSRGDSATVRIFIEVPSYARLPGRRAHVYLYHRDRPRGRHVGSALLQRGSGRRFTATVRFESGGLVSRNFAGFCIRETARDPWGRWRAIDRECGSRYVPKP
jgi:hypothetical protein